MRKEDFELGSRERDTLWVADFFFCNPINTKNHGLSLLHRRTISDPKTLIAITREYSVKGDMDSCKKAFDDHLMEFGYSAQNDAGDIGLEGSLFEGRVLFDWLKYSAEGKKDIWVGFKGGDYSRPNIITTTKDPKSIKVEWTQTKIAMSNLVARRHI